MLELKQKEIELLGHFRSNARATLTEMSKATRIPVSTIFDKLRQYEDGLIIKKHTTLLDFRKLGYDIKIQLLVMVDKGQREGLQRFLAIHPKVNTVFRVNNGYDFLIEAIFRDMNELDEFTRKLDEHGIREKKEFFVMEEIKREEFMAYKDNLGVQR